MLGLMPIEKVVAIVAGLYGGLLVLIGIPTLDFRLALGGATIIQLLLLAWIYFWWRTVWRWFPSLNQFLFPDLNGDWGIEINWHKEGSEAGIVRGRATIHQNFHKISMEVSTEDSDSQTLIAVPKRDAESGTPQLFYIYRVVTKASKGSVEASYRGAAVLAFSKESGGRLRGNYWTSRLTSGHFTISRS